MFAIALVFGTLYIVGRGVFGMILTMHADAAAWSWTATLWLAICATVARAARSAHCAALRHLGSRHRLLALARPRTLTLVLVGVVAPRLPSVGAAVSAEVLYAALLAYAVVLTAFPRVRDRVDRFCYDQLFDEQRASDLRDLGIAPARPAVPAVRPMLRVAPYASREPSIADTEPLLGGAANADEDSGLIQVHYDGKLAAVAAADEYFLVGRYAELDDKSAEAKFVSMMAVYAMEIASGRRWGTYSDEAARIVARISLVPAEVFERGLVDRDATARAYGVPVWELGPEAVELTRPRRYLTPNQAKERP
jgi:hypothetical protein